MSDLCISTYIMFYFIVQGLGDEQHHRDPRGYLLASQQPQRFVSKFFRTIKETIHQEFFMEDDSFQALLSARE
jgi:hypothetical protein